MFAKIIDSKSKYYYTGILNKGTVLSPIKRFGDNEALVPAYKSIKVGNKYFLLDNFEELEKGMEVSTRLGNGIIQEIGKNLCAVKIDNDIKTFYKKDIDIASDPIESMVKALENYEELKSDIDIFVKSYNTEYAKSFFGRISNKIKGEEPSMEGIQSIKAMSGNNEGLNKLADTTPKILPLKVPETSVTTITPKNAKPIGGKISTLPRVSETGNIPKSILNQNKSSTEDVIQPATGAKETKELPLSNENSIYGKVKKTFNTIKDFVKPKGHGIDVYDYTTGNKITRLNSVPEIKSNQHILSHIDLNPEAKSPGEKYNYHYKVGGQFKKLNAPIDEEHNAYTKLPEHLQGRIFLPDEPVKFQGNDFRVKSHISPITENGQPDYSKMLITDKEGKTYSVSRAEVQPLQADIAQSKPNILENGQNAYHHQLKKGDVILKDGERHEVIAKNDKGYLTYNHNTNGLYWHDAQDYDKDFRHNDYRFKKKADIGDEITFNHNGTMKTRPVLQSTDKGVVVQVNKSDAPLEINHGEYKFTGNKAHKQFKPEVPDKNTIETSGEERPTFDEIKDKLISNAPEDTSRNYYNDTIQNLNNITKPHNIEKTSDNEQINKLGIGNLAVKTEYNPETKEMKQNVLNPNIMIGKRKYKVTGIEGDALKVKEIPLNALKETKEQKVPINQIKDIIRSRENSVSTDEDNKVNNMVKNNLKEDLIKNISKELYGKGINDVNNVKMNDFKDSIEPHIGRYQKNMDTLNRGNETIEPEEYKPYKVDTTKGLEDLLTNEVGDSWKNKIQEHLNQFKKNKENADIQEENNKKELERLDRVKELQNQIKENTPTEIAKKNYIKYNKGLKELNPIKGKESKIFIKDSPYNDTNSNFVLTDANKVQTSHIPSGDAWKPYRENKNYPKGSQLFGYGLPSEDPLGYKNRDENLYKVNNFDPELVFNDNKEGDRGTPIIDKHGFVMGGNDRTMAYQQLSKEKLEQSANHLKKHLDRFFDFKSPEEKTNMLKQIDNMVAKGERPMIARQVDYKYHENPEKYQGFTTELNKSSQKPIGASEEAKGILNKIPTEKVQELSKMVGKDKVDKYLNSSKNVENILKWAKDIIPSSELSIMHDGNGNLTGRGKDIIKQIHSKNYLTNKDVHKALDSIPQGSSIRQKITDVSHILLPLKSTLYDLEPNINNAISLTKEKMNTGKEDNGSKMFKDSATDQAMEHLLNHGDSNQLEEILNNYYDKSREWENNKNQIGMFGDTMTPEEQKEAYFKNLINNDYNISDNSLKSRLTSFKKKWGTSPKGEQ